MSQTLNITPSISQKSKGVYRVDTHSCMHTSIHNRQRLSPEERTNPKDSLQT